MTNRFVFFRSKSNLPVENCASQQKKSSHWSERLYGNDSMKFQLEKRTFQLLSTIHSPIDTTEVNKRGKDDEILLGRHSEFP